MTLRRRPISKTRKVRLPLCEKAEYGRGLLLGNRQFLGLHHADRPTFTQ